MEHTARGSPHLQSWVCLDVQRGFSSYLKWAFSVSQTMFLQFLTGELLYIGRSYPGHSSTPPHPLIRVTAAQEYLQSGTQKVLSYLILLWLEVNATNNSQ